MKLKGQTLVEMLVVIFIIGISLYAVVTLIIFNVGLQEQDADQTVAMNLAREGLEFVQNKRDSNWLAAKAFSYGILDQAPADCTAVPAWDGSTAVPNPFFDFTPNTIVASRVYKATTGPALGVYTNKATTSTTDFYRLLTFASICQDPNNPSNKAPADNVCVCPPVGKPTYTQLVGIRAKADIQWFRKGKQKNLTIYGDFYDWR
ncbi:MAG: type II secretion system protein [Patescibacteria group bacterium]|nr:type II secretion system protein [Patescibacteria group bacterium]